MNNINRQNYEGFFLLYTDNELLPAEKMAVEEFVQMNPDLHEELIMLQQTVLMPENIAFNEKNLLLKNEGLPSGIEEKLLLYLDNELPAVDKAALTAMITASQEIKKEWNILQHTKLLPDDIVFADKHILYKKEPSRVIAFRIWKLAAAAALIGFGLWGGLAYFNNTDNLPSNDVSKKMTKEKIQITPKPAAIPTEDQVAQTTTKEKEITSTKEIIKKQSTSSPIIIREKISAKKLPQREIAATKEKAPDNNLPAPYFDNVNNIDRNKIIATNVTPQKQSSNIVDPKNSDIVKSTGKQDPANSFASRTSFAEPQEDNNDRVLFMDEEKIKKTKLGGIFRKVKRVLERTANIKQDGNNKIKVANLEFAIQ
ncbi:MAG: hypothetical protein ABIN94_10910 [Ferruginibacter sp.]